MGIYWTFSRRNRRIIMKDKLQALLDNHRLISSEIWHELNELSKIDTSKFSDVDARDIEQSIYDLENELVLRKSFVNELETLL